MPRRARTTQGFSTPRRQRVWANARFFQDTLASASFSRDLLSEFTAVRSTTSFKGWTVGGIHLTLIAQSDQAFPAPEPFVDFGVLVGHVDRIGVNAPDVSSSQAADDWMALGAMSPGELGGPRAVRLLSVRSMRRLDQDDSLFLQTRLTTNGVDNVNLSVRSRVLLLQP